MASKDIYFVPESSKWPIVGSLALFTTFVGSAMLLNQSPNAKYVFIAGIAAVIYMFAGWFSNVIAESLSGKYNKQVDISFRMGMGWFILSEVMFFAAFFGALFYARVLSVPWLSGEGHGVVTHQFLWPAFKASWPMSVMPNPTNFTVYKDTIPAFGLPAVNTLILLISGVTVTFAHWALKKAQRNYLNIWLAVTVALGALFVYLQATEYHHAYTELSLKLSSGIYLLTCVLKILFTKSILFIYLPAILILLILIVGEFVLDLNSRSLANIISLNIFFIFPATVISLIG
jgi:cytochrome c oxidase subunit 3